MQSYNQVLTQFNPIEHQRPTDYALFMVNGSVPFTVTDLTALWNEWQKQGATYNGVWQREKDRFFNLFERYQLLKAKGLKATLAIIYPTGEELLWQDGAVTKLTSMRGQQLAQVAKLLQTAGDLGLAVVVQYAHNDPAGVYEVPTARQNVDQAELMAAVGRARLDETYKAKPVVSDRPLPLTTLNDFWAYFRNNNGYLRKRYGLGAKVSASFNRSLYEQGEYAELFKRLVELDQQVPADKLLFAAFIYDAGSQYALYRLPLALRQGDAFLFAKLPASGGSKLMMARMPAGVRVVVKTLYVEQ